MSRRYHVRGWIALGMLLGTTWAQVGWITAAEPAVAEAPAAQPQSAEKPAEQAKAGKLIRIERDADGEPLALQTAIVHLLPTDPAKAGLQIDLIGAVHIGEKDYYEALNKRFEGYDVVLFELVAPAGTRVPKGAKPSGHPVAMLQNGLKDMLQLEHQLENIDYTKENMVHADMSPDEFAKSMKDRGESFFGMFFRMMGQAMAKQSLENAKAPDGKKKGAGDIDLLAAFFDKDRAGTLKRVMAEQFEDLEGMMDALNGPKGSTIITERNKVVLKKLDEQIAAGKKKIAIFFGAGHMSHIEEQLAADLNLRRAGEEWLTAWKLEKPSGEAEEGPKAEPKKPSARISPERRQLAHVNLLAYLCGAK